MNVTEIVKLLAVRQNKENDLIYQELLRSEVISHDARLRKQQFDKGGPTENYVVHLKKIPLVRETDDFGEILSTKYRVPKSIREDPPFITVTNSVSSRRKRNISYLADRQLAYLAYRKFTSDSICYSLEDSFIKLHNGEDLMTIDISFIPDNYLDLSCDCVKFSELEISNENSSLILSSFMTNGKDQE